MVAGSDLQNLSFHIAYFPFSYREEVRMSHLLLNLADTLVYLLKDLFKSPLSSLLTVTLRHHRPFSQVSLIYATQLCFFKNVYGTGTLKR